MRTALLGSSLLALVMTSQASAAIIEASRSIHVTCELCGTSQTRVGPRSGHWSAGLGVSGTSASQDSWITGLQFSGSGTVSMFTSGDFTTSNYHVVFDVPAPIPFTFDVVNLEPIDCFGGYPTNAPSGSVTLNAVDPANPGTVIGSLYSVTLARNQVDPFCGEGYPGLSVEGTLEPGAYALDFRLSYVGSHIAGWPGTASFDLVLAPEPAAGLLVAFGLLGLAGWRRSH
jgi:hypothetical protein